jgi:hypothetical protein
MEVHNFHDEDLRILASLAIDLFTDHLEFKVFKTIKPEENYWSIDCRFTYDKDKFEIYYDSLHIDCGRDNKPETYQMSWNIKKNDLFQIRPITSPLLVIHYFEELCKKEHLQQN